MTRRPRRWSAREREQAAIICSAKALDWQEHRFPAPPLIRTWEAAKWIGAEQPVADLAWAAFVATHKTTPGLLVAWAEASSMLRDGWTPEDSHDR